MVRVASASTAAHTTCASSKQLHNKLRCFTSYVASTASKTRMKIMTKWQDSQGGDREKEMETERKRWRQRDRDRKKDKQPAEVESKAL